VQAINKITLGTVQFGIKYGINNSTGKLSKDEVLFLLGEAYDMGVRTLDTAELYGDAHELIGEYHANNPHRLFKIITKFPHEINGNITEKITQYLKILQIEKLEGLLFHSYESYQKELENLSLISSFKEVGIIKNIGVSIYTNSQMEAVIKNDHIDIIQLPFNLLDNNNLRGDMIKKAKNAGKTIHTRSAFLQGLFFMPLTSNNPILKALQYELELINNIIVQEHIDVQSLALNYCLQQENIDNILIGVDNITQLRQNIQKAQQPLSKELLERIDKIKVKQPDLLNPSLWKQF